jgi:Holliday junction resolvase RusA-like endonuclease
MEPFKGAVSLCYQFWMDKPKSSKNDLAIVKPDLDNLSKGLTDALSKCGFWKDDCQIIALTAVKVYNDTPLPPRIEIKMDFAS